MKIEWDSSMSVGEETIDNQHKRLLEKINELVEILSSLEVDMGAIRQTGQFLFTYIKEHFEYEENYMEKNNYPDLEVHKKMHQDFVQFYKEFQIELRDRMSSDKFSSIDITELLEKIKKYLLEWLVQHIKGIDQKYAKFIKRKS